VNKYKKTYIIVAVCTPVEEGCSLFSHFTGNTGHNGGARRVTVETSLSIVRVIKHLRAAEATAKLSDDWNRRKDVYVQISPKENSQQLLTGNCF